ncbi:RNA polymerase sigma-70 factor, ECF subfamily [Abditibacterium utsteinense]|uniref:RNA polymerase sigma-70 factor, ECF subfamily n=1 Tax=Abditibacterium utsteinense TaxID=1960156 RepID=A0A2S8SQF8_9BACT|nr:sigma-70 family RNA polymerase sigma factor [Abditibacterium utsteinense]PQV63033.1 RNA polymerase sigma-70 factor, ECF subfamily [Abditibacterium utsteinense]
MPDSPRAAHFETLLAPILDRAFSFAVRLTGNRDDASDLVQDTALRAFAALDSFDGNNFKSWFFQILMNCHLNRARSQSRRPQTTDLDEAPDHFLYQQAQQLGKRALGLDPATAILDEFDSQLIARALLDLPDDFRAVATLYLLEEMSYDQIASILNCPVGTVRSRLHRARKLLQKSLWELATERGLMRC